MPNTSSQENEESKDEYSRRPPQAAQSSTCARLPVPAYESPTPILISQLGLIRCGEGNETRIDEAKKANEANRMRTTLLGLLRV